MQLLHRKLHSADVVAVFENQDDADEALLRLQLAGFRDDQLGYYAWHTETGFMDLLDRSYRGVGSVAGFTIGGLLGFALAVLINERYVPTTNVRDFFGLSVTCVIFMALFVSFLGWWIGAGITHNGVETPAVDPSIGPFILAISTERIRNPADRDYVRDRAWQLLHRSGGHELPPGALMAHPGMA